MKDSKLKTTLIALPFAGAVTGVLLWALNQAYPKVGCDYRYFLPRLLDSHLYYLRNRPAIQWWTPSFGGGLPSFPNPQQMQFSLPQLWILIVDPWPAINLATAVMSLAGFFACYGLFTRTFGHDRGEAILGATLFSVSAFYMEHMRVGHLSFHAFPLLPLILLLLLSRRLPMAAKILMVAFALTYLNYAAGFFLSVIFAFSLATSLLLATLLYPGKSARLLRSVGVLAGAGCSALLFSAAKIVAVMSFLRFFPREIADSYDVSLPAAVTGFFAQLFYTPIAALFGIDSVHDTLTHLTGADYGLWELDIGLSPVVPFLLVSCVAVALRQKALPAQAGTRSAAVLISLLLLLWVVVEITLTRGFFYGFSKSLPVMKSLHVNVRFASILILPLVMLTIRAHSSVVAGFPRDAMVSRLFSPFLLSALAIAIFSRYPVMDPDHVCNAFDVRGTRMDWQNMQEGAERFRVKGVARIGDHAVFSRGYSSLRLYEPLFGYGLESFTPRIRVGPLAGAPGEPFNLTHPASLVFPDENDLVPFQRVPVSDAPNFEAFVSYGEPAWQLSSLQRGANLLSLTGMGLGFVILLAVLSRSRREAESGIRN